jgi:hypothetical protein
LNTDILVVLVVEHLLGVVVLAADVVELTSGLNIGKNVDALIVCEIGFLHSSQK